MAVKPQPLAKMILVQILSRNNFVRGLGCRLSSSMAPQTNSSEEASKLKMVPNDVYNKRVASNELADDTHQRRVVGHLDELHTRIKGHTPLPLKKANFITKLFFADAEEKRVHNIPKGLYIWGTVGGGNFIHFYSHFDKVFNMHY